VLAPVCECRLRRTPEAVDAGSLEPYEYERYAGNREDGCSDLRTSGQCLYCENEFPGCDVNVPTSCDAVCADIAERDHQDHQQPDDVSIRAARCSTDRTCSVVTAINGQCYLGDYGAFLPAPIDCNLPDTELRARLERLESGLSPIDGEACAPRPEVTCQSSEDCPRGLSCADGVCGPCTRFCTTTVENPSVADDCRGGGACADGEVCAEDMCIPATNATCKSVSDCPENHSCVVSGLSGTARGNEASQSFCRPDDTWLGQPSPP